MPVEDLARRTVVTASPDTDVQDLAATMREEDVGSVVVTEGDEPVGIATDRDVALRVVADGLDPDGATTADVMTENPVVVAPEAGFYETARAMSEHGVRRIPLVEDDELVGILTADDLTELLADESEALADVIRAQRPPY
ncbi:MAG: CBS domain-containing protein [Halobacteriaceae archaeon]